MEESMKANGSMDTKMDQLNGEINKVCGSRVFGQKTNAYNDLIRAIYEIFIYYR